MQQITVTATKARKSLFELIDRVAKENTQVVISKKGLDDVVLQKRIAPKKDKELLKKNTQLVQELYGSLKSKVPYQKDEMKQAADIFVKEYKEKYGLT